MDRITAAKVFIEVVERQSQTAAAGHLDMSRAMVSRHLKALEEWVGTRLLHRTTYPKGTLRVACSVFLAQSVLSLLTCEFV